jgi:hypothetical protein
MRSVSPFFLLRIRVLLNFISAVLDLSSEIVFFMFFKLVGIAPDAGGDLRLSAIL